jgi:hypothetical protein
MKSNLNIVLNAHFLNFYTELIHPKKTVILRLAVLGLAIGIYKPAWKKIPEINAKFVGRLLEPAFVK